ncbi:MAG: ABC transporter permease [Nitrososphaerales archaeon]
MKVKIDVPPIFIFLTKRILYSIFVLFGVITIVFIVTRVALPNPAVAWAGGRVTESFLRTIEERYHLNEPVYTQFYYYLQDLLSGNWGEVPQTGEPVLENIRRFLPATIELTLFAVLIMIAIGIPLGVIAAVNKDKTIDHTSRIVALLGVSSPPFLFALLLQLIFFYHLGLIPESGGRISSNLGMPTYITGLIIFDGLIVGDWEALTSALQHIILPAFSLAFLNLGLISRLTRSSMLEALASDYVRTAKAKGLSKNKVIYKHALRNSLIQPITVLNVYIAYFLGGSLVVETIFSWPGMGRYAANSIVLVDLPSIMGITIVFTIAVIITNLIADIIYAILDPRLRKG